MNDPGVAVGSVSELDGGLCISRPVRRLSSTGPPERLARDASDLDDHFLVTSIADTGEMVGTNETDERGVRWIDAASYAAERSGGLRIMGVP